MTTCDVLVIGGGVIGLSIARELRRRRREARIVLIEKEPACGAHASGRNSGVLHAGFYYSPDSLKAKFTKLGNERLTAYCEEKRIPLNRCGKLVVAKDAGDLPSLDELIKRGNANGIALQELTEADARKIEPRVRTYQRALFSPRTSTVNPLLVVDAMRQDAEREGIEIHCGTAYVGTDRGRVRTTRDTIEAGYLVNAAGLYADKIAMDYGFSERYRILPFKGLYLYSNEPPGSIRTNIYPVPDLRNPFLGVHFTITADGKAKIGPTAIPAFWREHYDGFGNFRLSEALEVVGRGLGLLTNARFDYRRLAVEEIAKYSRKKMVALASVLADGVREEHYLKWGRPGIRAQLLDITKRKLEMDFVLEGDHRSMHVLNAVSPAFTCSLPFAEYVCDRIQAAVG
ncbi:L-2-hydroxyglutarate oxidase [Nitrospira moscoviensis]|uniref:L-2-hydroxyglutarate oxidase n=1 Tax=Nitrospira moscoviensis TaxID=42253 RepID=A0A0K2GFH2_NITMO|nr:L-2-hydroxyglutarate oxidase [Nitrospira moscoviensis]ALA59710.1 L-2-hydroxyglutarate oxidase [Nitrospira moscoviensis]